MPETPKSQNKEAFNAFVVKYNLDPLNNNAIMNCLFELNEKIETLEKDTERNAEIANYNQKMVDSMIAKIYEEVFKETLVFEYYTPKSQ